MTVKELWTSFFLLGYFFEAKTTTTSNYGLWREGHGTKNDDLVELLKVFKFSEPPWWTATAAATNDVMGFLKMLSANIFASFFFHHLWSVKSNFRKCDNCTNILVVAMVWYTACWMWQERCLDCYCNSFCFSNKRAAQKVPLAHTHTSISFSLIKKSSFCSSWCQYLVCSRQNPAAAN